ncbi:MAG: hypothetical protein C0622_01675 [Desulfuromonas sp.]|nr:MAG: hypothetical protein C0622_01675 [Desulfuromonas sp.]
MKRLTLIRHAKSAWGDPALDDFDRPLNSRGKTAAPRMGEHLARDGLCPDLIVSSPAKRARKTARLIARELDYPAEAILYRQQIYEAELDTLIELVHGLPEEEHVMLVGHNPGMSELGQWFNPEAPDWLPTCAVLTLELDIGAWQNAACGSGVIGRYDYPKKAR